MADLVKVLPLRLVLEVGPRPTSQFNKSSYQGQVTFPRSNLHGQVNPARPGHQVQVQVSPPAIMVITRPQARKAFNHILDVVFDQGDGTPLKSSLVDDAIDDIFSLVSIDA